MTKSSQVLFVDDDPSVLASFVRGFRKSSFTVCIATCGKEALEIMQQSSISVIVADYSMPNMKGTKLLRICKERWPDRVRILLTGKGNLDIALNATYDGWVYQYLEKPIKIEELQVIIEEAIQLIHLPNDPEYARLLLSKEVLREMNVEMHVPLPERPTLAIDSSPLNWAIDLCQTELLPPEQEKLRSLVETLHQITEIIDSVPETKVQTDAFIRIKQLVDKIR